MPRDGTSGQGVRIEQIDETTVMSDTSGARLKLEGVDPVDVEKYI